jgi:hypothetical protein
MEIRNRLFPYPVLCEDTDDYVDGDFYVEAKLVEQGLNDILIQFDMHLENSGLQSLINTGKAEFVIHMECSNTAFRTVIKTFSNAEQYRIMNSRVNGDINLLGMIVSKEKIGHYTNPLLNEDYEGITLNLDKASILAYDNMDPIHIAKNYEELAEKDSIFSVVKEMRIDQNERKPIWYRLDNDRIKIIVDEEVYASYIRYQGNSTMQPLMMSLLVMPALTYMMEVLRNEDWEGHASDYWFIKIQKFYKIHGLDFVDDIILNEDKMISEAVQEMLQLPIGKTLLSIPEMLGE